MDIRNKGKILIVDDSKVYQMMIQETLKEYSTLLADDGVIALERLVENDDIDIVVLDINMPRMNGFQVLEHIQKDMAERNLSVIILSNSDQVQDELRGLEEGAVDYIRKPLNGQSLQKRIDVHMNLIHTRKALENHSLLLEELVDYRTEQLKESRDITINALVSLLEVRDIESANHTIRTKRMMKVLCEHLATKSDFRKYLTKTKIDMIAKTTPLHDIGKVGVADSVLLKPGILTAEEFNEVKKHVNYGINALIADNNSIDNAYLRTAIRIIGGHHEKYDGTGYPIGLKRDEIPLEGRLMAIVDVYDALRSKRIYKEAFSHEKSLEIMLSERGTHFDPVLLDAFFEIENSIIDIFKECNDQGECKESLKDYMEQINTMMRWI